MKYLVLMALLLMSLAWNATAQQNQSHLQTNRTHKNKFLGRSHIEVDLERQNALLVGFQLYSQVRAHRNIDSVLRLFVADYRQVADTAQTGTEAFYAFFRLGETDRTLDLRPHSQAAASFRLSDTGGPVQLKTQQDTLHIVWRSRETPVAASPQAYDFHVYLLLNSLSDVERLLRQGGVNARLQQALDAVERYDKHNLTNPRLSYDLVQREGKEPQVIAPGPIARPMLIISPAIGAGLVRSQWTPSLSLDLHLVPSQYRNVSYSVGYLSTFFFQTPADGGYRTFRNDFVNVGVTFYRNDKGNGISSFSRALAGFYVGLPVYRSGGYFDRNTIRLSGTVFHQNLIKIQPEIYMKGAFRNVFPGVRVSVGL